MASYYFDTSALIKLYIQEPGSAAVLAVAEGVSSDHLVILELTLLECRSAVRRRERAGDISGSVANQILERIEQDGSSYFLVQPTASAIDVAARLLDTHALRTLDALQLAGCLTIRHSTPPPLTFVCADGRLCDAANLEGLATLNPIE